MYSVLSAAKLCADRLGLICKPNLTLGYFATAQCSCSTDPIRKPQGIGISDLISNGKFGYMIPAAASQSYVGCVYVSWRREG